MSRWTQLALDGTVSSKVGVSYRDPEYEGLPWGQLHDGLGQVGESSLAFCQELPCSHASSFWDPQQSYVLLTVRAYHSCVPLAVLGVKGFLGFVPAVHGMVSTSRDPHRVVSKRRQLHGYLAPLTKVPQ